MRDFEHEKELRTSRSSLKEFRRLMAAIKQAAPAGKKHKNAFDRARCCQNEKVGRNKSLVTSVFGGKRGELAVGSIRQI